MLSSTRSTWPLAAALALFAGIAMAQAPSASPAPQQPPLVPKAGAQPTAAAATTVVVGEPKLELHGPPAPPPGPVAVPPLPRSVVDALARTVDQHLDRRLSAEKVTPSPIADDAEFVRRVWLDLAGKVPPAERAEAFLASRDSGKRQKLIDELTASPDFARHQADIWQALLIPRNSDNRRIAIAPLTKWLEDRFHANRPWDETVKALLIAEGTTADNAATTYYLGHLLMVDRITDNVTRLFLGVQLQCAQCHNHPFTGWKQDEYWGMAAFFTKVRMSGNPRQAIRQGAQLALSETGRGRPARLPESARRVPPKFLQGDAAKIAGDGPNRPALAEWLAQPKNPYFARAFVNRAWQQVFGQALVNPVDDMHDGHVASHPELLKELADQFAAQKFDVKYLYRALCSSRAYQRTSKPYGNNGDAGPELFARMAIKPLTAEQLYDSLVQVLGDPTEGRGRGRRRNVPAQMRGPNANVRNVFVSFFGNDEGNTDPTEYQAGIPQVLRLMNGPFTNGAAFRVLASLRYGGGPADVFDQMYLRVLSRLPSAAERDRLLAIYRENSTEPRQLHADVLWALLNSSEFALNH